MENVLTFKSEACEIIELLPDSIIVDIPVHKTKQELEDEKSGRSISSPFFNRITIRLIHKDNLFGLKIGYLVDLEYNRICLDGKYTYILKSIKY